MTVAGAVKQVSEHAGALLRLEVELARREIGRSAERVARVVVLGALAALLALFAVGFGFGAAAAALTLFLPVWAALLVVAGILLLLGGSLALLAMVALRRKGDLLPRQALEEARLTLARLRRSEGDSPGHG